MVARPTYAPRASGCAPRSRTWPFQTRRANTNRHVDHRAGVVGSASTIAGVAQWLEFQPSKLAMRVRFPSPAPRVPSSVRVIDRGIFANGVIAALARHSEQGDAHVQFRFMLDVVAPVGG